MPPMCMIHINNASVSYLLQMPCLYNLPQKLTIFLYYILFNILHSSQISMEMKHFLLFYFKFEIKQHANCLKRLPQYSGGY